MNNPLGDLCLRAARCPESLQPHEFGAWKIERRNFRSIHMDVPAAILKTLNGGDTQTCLRRITEATMHSDGEIVMEDSLSELRRHLPIFLAARGRILITGLGLGCVVRGLLVNPDVSHIDVVEIDRQILERVGVEFADNPRVTLHHGDALTYKMPRDRWDFAWHDIWCEGNRRLHVLHLRLLRRYHNRVGRQGAWMLPRTVKRRLASAGWPLLG